MSKATRSKQNVIVGPRHLRYAGYVNTRRVGKKVRINEA